MRKEQGMNRFYMALAVVVIVVYGLYALPHIPRFIDHWTTIPYFRCDDCGKRFYNIKWKPQNDMCRRCYGKANGI